MQKLSSGSYLIGTVQICLKKKCVEEAGAGEKWLILFVYLFFKACVEIIHKGVIQHTERFPLPFEGIHVLIFQDIKLVDGFLVTVDFFDEALFQLTQVSSAEIATLAGYAPLQAQQYPLVPNQQSALFVEHMKGDFDPTAIVAQGLCLHAVDFFAKVVTIKHTLIYGGFPS